MKNNDFDLDLLLRSTNHSQVDNFTDRLLIKAWELTQKYSEDVYDRTENNLTIAEFYRDTNRKQIADKIVKFTLDLNRQSESDPFVACNYIV